MEPMKRPSLRRKRQEKHEFIRAFHTARVFVLRRVLDRYNRLDISPSISFESDCGTEVPAPKSERLYEFNPHLDIPEEGPSNNIPSSQTDTGDDAVTDTTCHETTSILKKPWNDDLSYNTFPLDDLDLSDHDVDELLTLSPNRDNSRNDRPYLRSSSSFLARDLHTITFLKILADPFIVYSYMRLWSLRIKEIFRKGDVSLAIHVSTIVTISCSIVTVCIASNILCLLAAGLSIFFGCYVRIQFRKRLVRKELLDKRYQLNHAYSNLSMENASLKRKVMELKANIARMKPIKSELYNIAYHSSMEPPLLLSLVIALDQTKKDIKVRLQSHILQNVVKAMFMSNREGRSYVVNPITLGLITSKMKSIPYLQFFPDRLKQAIEAHGDTFISMIRLCLYHLNRIQVVDDCRRDAKSSSIDTNLIFQFQPK